MTKLMKAFLESYKPKRGEKKMLHRIEMLEI